MIAVIFEAWPADGQAERYLDLAAALRADLDKVDGFLSVERFQSLAEPGKLLSLSFFRDEDAVRVRARGLSPRAEGERDNGSADPPRDWYEILSER
ncbi:antibiotic biosynthesis monooxygenase [Leptolyngbya sp. 15MV]|nr:antibiotic biosynthesis monooxygenase [Leptolyngbya sp. 15MV]